MTRALKLKPDLDKTIERFEAWWHGELIDRPPVTFNIPPTTAPKLPQMQHASMRERWLDVEYQVETALAHIRNRAWVGDSIPAWHPNVGPELTSTVFGCDLECSEHTSWSVPTIHCVEQWRDVINTEPNFDNEYWRFIDQATDLALQRFAGEALVGIADLHGNMDILAGLREPQDLCMDLMDDPQLVFEAQMHAARAYVKCFDRLYAKLAAAGQGSITWTPCYHQGPAYVPSSDFWCLLSGEQARDIVLPGIKLEMTPLNRSIFHLDGPAALRHLDLLLELDDLHAVQWVQGAGNGPATQWIDVYRRCLDAGKSVQIIPEGGPDIALACLEALGPRGVWFCPVNCTSVDEANAFVKELQRLTAAMA